MLTLDQRGASAGTRHSCGVRAGLKAGAFSSGLGVPISLARAPPSSRGVPVPSPGLRPLTPALSPAARPQPDAAAIPEGPGPQLSEQRKHPLPFQLLGPGASDPELSLSPRDVTPQPPGVPTKHPGGRLGLRRGSPECTGAVSAIVVNAGRPDHLCAALFLRTTGPRRGPWPRGPGAPPSLHSWQAVEQIQTLGSSLTTRRPASQRKPSTSSWRALGPVRL